MNRPKKQIYYNVSIPHNDILAPNGRPTNAVFSEVRDEPLFPGSPKKWRLSVIRMTVPTSYIPIQFFPVEINPLLATDPNYSIYTVTMSYLGNTFQQHLEWIPQDADATVPVGPISVFELQNNIEFRAYYSLYSLKHFVTIINNALETCFTTNIKPLLPAPPAGTSYVAPFMDYDVNTRLFSLYTQNIFLDTEVNPVSLFFNIRLDANFVTSFDLEYQSYDSLLGAYARFVILNRNGLNRTVDATAPDGFIYRQNQEFNTIGQITNFSSLLVRSISLPILNEAITIRGDQSKIGSSNETIITDVEINLSDILNLRNYIHYIPTAQYRYVTMHGDTPITRIDLEILWKDAFDNIYPVAIPDHDIATIKILFEEVII
jgi:hypothetical protein